MKTSKISIINLIDRALDLYEEARASNQAYTVTQIARRNAKGKGRGAATGRRYHKRIPILDPYAAAYEPVWASPLPLAWRFRFGWLYGVADQVVFEEGSLKAVIEYKSYYNVNKMEITQASLYGLLASLVFATRPTVYVKALKKIMEVSEWEIWALKALRRLRGP